MLKYILALAISSAVAGADPKISGVMVDGQASTLFTKAGPYVKAAKTDSALVTWTTAKPATSQVQLYFGNVYSSCAADGSYTLFPFNISSELSTSHSVLVTGLAPNIVYCLRIAAADSSGQGWLYPLSPGFLSFQTAAADATAAKNYRLDISAPKTVYAGHDIYVSLTAVLLAGKDDNTATYSIPVLKDQSGTVIPAATVSHDYPPCHKNTDGTYWCYRMDYNPSLLLHTPATLPPGHYTVTSSVLQAGSTFPFSWAFNVLAPATAPVRTAITSVPPLDPAVLALRKTRMTTDGKTFCKPGEFMAFGYEGQIWYYDGGRSYLQIGDYTGDKSTWYPCAQNILSQMADRNIPSQIHPWEMTPHGLAMAYWRFGDQHAKTALNNMYGAPGPYTRLIRETAYAISAGVKRAQVNGAPLDAGTLQAVDYGLGIFDQLISNPNQLQQPFMNGILASGLIDYYEYTVAHGVPDYRIPPAVKQTMGWLWANAIITDPKDSLYGHAYYFPPLFHGYKLEPHTGITTTRLRLGAVYASLNDLFSPVWAWYYNLTGDDKYRQQGDVLWSHGFDEDGAGIWNGKQFNQHFKWEFDYPHYRLSATPVLSLADPANNPPDTSYVWNTTPPVISALTVTASSTSVVLAWTTDKPSSTWGKYGTAAGKYTAYIPNVANSVPNDTLTAMRTDHTLTLTGLTAGTTYHYIVISRDALGNNATSANQTFVTLATAAAVVH